MIDCNGFARKKNSGMFIDQSNLMGYQFGFDSESKYWFWSHDSPAYLNSNRFVVNFSWNYWTAFHKKSADLGHSNHSNCCKWKPMEISSIIMESERWTMNPFQISKRSESWHTKLEQREYVNFSKGMTEQTNIIITHFATFIAPSIIINARECGVHFALFTA